MENTRTAAFAAVLLCVALGGCETLSGMSSSSPQQPVAVSPKPPPSRPARFNLTGYPTAFKQGYADACATPKRRDAERFRTDTDYSMGWQDGSSACRAR
jgi:hypothetical protein